MNRLLGILFGGLVLCSFGWSQSVWRGQAEVWTGPDAPTDGYVAASNEFPKNTLLRVENFRSQKTIDVRVVSTLPLGSSALVVLNEKAASALDIKPGDFPMVGVSPDASGTDLASNPDPDINPATDTPDAAAPAAATTPAEVPVPGSAPAALPVVPESSATPQTPGRTVFQSTAQPTPEAPAPVVTDATPPAAAPAATDAPAPATGTPAPASSDATSAPAPAEVATAPAAPEPAPAAPAPEPATPTEPAPVPESAPAVATPAAPAAPALSIPPPALPPSAAWVSTPLPLRGPVLGQVVWVKSLEHGRAYVQVGAWASQAELVGTLDKVKSYVPVVLYKAEGEKNPWRLLVAAPKSQLGVLLNSYRAQGYTRATVIKG